jgi:uncharacterized protein
LDRRLPGGQLIEEGGPALKHRKDAVVPLLDRFVAGVPGVSEAFMVAADGLLVASSGGVDRARADTVAAIAANLYSLASRSAELLLAGRVAVAMTEMSGGVMLLMGLADGSVVVGWADGSCDVGQTGFELAALAERLS